VGGGGAAAGSASSRSGVRGRRCGSGSARRGSGNAYLSLWLLPRERSSLQSEQDALLRASGSRAYDGSSCWSAGGLGTPGSLTQPAQHSTGGALMLMRCIMIRCYIRLGRHVGGKPPPPLTPSPNRTGQEVSRGTRQVTQKLRLQLLCHRRERIKYQDLEIVTQE